MILLHHQKVILYEQAHVQARSLFNLIVIARQWVADNKDRIEPVPAVFTKELSKYAEKMSDFKFHITSLKLVNPENKPNEFEIKALHAFEKGKEEYSEIMVVDGKKWYWYMAPLKINQACLKCHQYQGYKVGQLRGGISISLPLYNIEKTLKDYNVLFYVLGFLFFILILFVVVVLINNLIIKHIKKLEKAAKNVINKNYNIKTNINTGDELQELSTAFDEMSERIAKSEEILKNRLKSAISKYVQIVDELKKKNEELKGVSQFKTDVLDSVSHEMRTPMTKILSYSEIITDPELSKDKELMEKAGTIIKNNLLLMKALFDQMITMSKLEHSKFEYLSTAFPVSKEIDKILNNYSKEILEKEISVTTNYVENFIIYMDENAFFHMMNNLIGNAIKYNKTKGILEITVERENNNLIITVYDTGIGITKEDINKIFNRFYRSEYSKKTHPGTGIGLSIVSRIIRDYNGNIKVESEFGVYTKFIVILPSVIMNEEKD
jgi:signal transduction histidine kinase